MDKIYVFFNPSLRHQSKFNPLLFAPQGYFLTLLATSMASPFLDLLAGPALAAEAIPAEAIAAALAAAGAEGGTVALPPILSAGAAAPLACLSCLLPLKIKGLLGLGLGLGIKSLLGEAGQGLQLTCTQRARGGRARGRAGTGATGATGATGGTAGGERGGATGTSIETINGSPTQ